MRTFDPTLYFVTPELSSAPAAEFDALVGLVAAVAAAGVTAVQLRDKSKERHRLVRRARRLVEVLAGTGVPLIVNDHPEVALESGAQGVHVGQRDAPWEVVRRVVGPELLIGVSIETEAQARALGGNPEIDYLGVSPLFPTPTKLDLGAPWGLAGLATLRRNCITPLVAIGGITAANVTDVVQHGADGVAVVSAIASAADPSAAARTLLTAIHAARVDVRRLSS